MNTTSTQEWRLQSAGIQLLLEAAASTASYDPVEIDGLPTHSVYLPGRDMIVAATTAAAPVFGAQIDAIAGQHRLDVLLLRLGERDIITADFALGSLPYAVWTEAGFSLFQDAWSTWLVPQGFGPAVSIGADGCMLEIVPPYGGHEERKIGIARAARSVVRFLEPVEG